MDHRRIFIGEHVPQRSPSQFCPWLMDSSNVLVIISAWDRFKYVLFLLFILNDGTNGLSWACVSFVIWVLWFSCIDIEYENRNFSLNACESPNGNANSLDVCSYEDQFGILLAIQTEHNSYDYSDSDDDNVEDANDRQIFSKPHKSYKYQFEHLSQCVSSFCCLSILFVAVLLDIQFISFRFLVCPFACSHFGPIQ